jgi:triacylglycerol lipase
MKFEVACLALLCAAAEPGPPVEPGVSPSPAQPGALQHDPYPIVLSHGLSGFRNIGPINYFYGVADALRKDGHVVYESKVDAYNTSEVRGPQLLAFVKDVLKETGAARVNLIGHSQGGLDARWVASEAGTLVASVTTISTPHRGSPVADIIAGDLPGPVQKAALELGNIIGAVIDGKADQAAEAALVDLTQEGALAFTRRHPDHPLVAYYSIAGRSNQARGDDACDTPTPATFVTRYDRYLDSVDPFLAVTGKIISDALDPAPSNDGLVTVGSARWGTFLGCIPADHLDEMCQIAGDGAGPGNPFDCHTFYRQLAAFLVARGH